MGVDHKLLKTLENFRGLDLRTSDLMRSQEFSTDMRNATYRISGAINKRKGFTHKRNSNFIKGMTTFKNIGANGSIVDELIYVENANIKKEVSFNTVVYRTNNVTGTAPVTLDFQKTTSDLTVRAIDDSVGTEYYNKTFTSSDTITDIINHLQYRTTLPAGSSNFIIDYDQVDMSEARLTWDRNLPSTPDGFDSTRTEINSNDGSVTSATANRIKMYIPLGNDLTQLNSYIAATAFHEDDGFFNQIYSVQHSFSNDLLKFGGRNILQNFNQGTNFAVYRQNTNPVRWDFGDSFQILRGHFDTDQIFVLEGSGNETPSEVKNWIVFNIETFFSNLDPDPTGSWAQINSGGDWVIYKPSSQQVSNIKEMRDYRLDTYSQNEIYNENCFRQVFALGIQAYDVFGADGLTSVLVTQFTNIHTPSTSTTAEKSISLADLLTNYNVNVNRLNQTEYWNLNTLSKLPLSSVKESTLTLQLRNKDNQAVSQFLSESVMSLDTNTTEISNNASSTFPTVVTTGSIEESVGTLSWTSDDYEDVLTENVNFASLNNLLYISNGIDDLLKYDGESVYKAGLPNCDEDIATFSFNTTTTEYLHDVKPGQVEYFTFNDTDYSNPNTLVETLPTDTKYMFKFNSNGFYRKSALVSGSYGSYSGLLSYSTFSSGTIVSGTDLEIEVITDSVGGIKNYYTINKGKNYKGQDDNGAGGDSIGITKAIFTGVSGDSTLVYGDLDIVDVSSAVRDRTYEYRFAYEYTDFKGNIISSQPSDPVKLVVGSSRSVNITFPLTISDLSTFKTNGVFDDAWEASTGVTLGTTLTDTNYPIEKLHDENRLRILVYRSKGYSPIAGEVVGQYYKIADLEYVAGGTEDSNNPGTFLPTTFTDKYRDEPSDPEAATQYNPVINPFLAFVEPIKRKDPPPKGKYLTVFKNCLVIAGQNDNVNNVQYSLPKNFTTGEIGSEYFPDDDNGIVVESPFGSKITAIAALKDLMFVFHRDSIFTVSGNINQLELPNVELLTKEGGVGCTSQASIEEFKGGLAFVSDTGIYSVSNQGLAEISQLIKPLFLQSNFIKEKAIAYNWTDKNLLLICIPDYVVQGDQEYNILEDTMEAYISKDSLILAYDYFREAWLRWDTLEFTNGITESDGAVTFARMTNTTNVLATISDNGDTDDYSDNGVPINFIYETNWESLGEPTVPKKFLRLKVHSFDTDESFESPNFTLEAGIQKNYVNANDGKIDFDFGKQAGGGWGNFRWGTDAWGSLPAQFLKSKLPTGKSRSLKLRFANQQNNENVLITNYELEIAVPYRPEIKE